MRYARTLPLLSLVLFAACSEYTPKPRGYVRIEPEKARYVPLPPAVDAPFTFSVSEQAQIRQSAEEKGSFRIAYPEWNATLYCNYLSFSPSRGNIDAAFRENRELVYRQARGAEGIRESAYSHPEAHVYGTLFRIEGNTAAPVQFALTDSIRHFFRGALYYHCPVNADSLAPVTSYLEKDIRELIETFRWKNEKQK